MKIYYGGNILLADNFPLKIGCLISYYKIKKNVQKPVWCDHLFLDSGAYSAFNKRTTIDLQGYINFCRKHQSLFKYYVSLDDLTSHEKSLANYKEMKQQGLDPLPCFHIGEPEWVLDEYLSSTNYIGLGGITGTKAMRSRREWLDKIFNKHPDPAKVGFHGFGIFDVDAMLQYPWRTVDSSSAHLQARYGGILTPRDWLKVNKSVRSAELKWISRMSEKQIKEWILKLNPEFFDYDIIISQSREGEAMRMAATVYYCEQLSRQTVSCFKKQKGIGFFKAI